MPSAPQDERVLILAPAGRDAHVAESILADAGILGQSCRDLSDLLLELACGAGAAVITEEVFKGGDIRSLSAWLEAQPSWSDFPIILLTRQGGGPERSRQALDLMDLLRNVTFLERPFHPTTLIAVVQTALRSRRRQYDARTRLEALSAATAAAAAAQAAAEQANRSKSHVLAAASHDLRQPLQSLFLLTGKLAAGSLGPPERETVDNLGRALAAMKVLLDAMLDVSKLDAGIVAVSRRDIRVSDLLNDIAASYRDRALQQKLDLRVVSCSAVVHSDAALLARILRNYVENALRYTRRGRVLVGCRRRGGHLLIQVTDTGIGIPAEKQREIFEEYVQVDNSARDREQGLGLGLAIVRRISELLAHPVSVRSELGRGSTFAVAVPLAAAPAMAAPPLPEPDAPQPWRLVLVIDDDALVLMGLVAMLERWGARTLSASSGLEAVEKLRGSTTLPDLIIADYRLRRGETGFAAIDGVRRAAGHPIPALLLTGDTAPDILRDARSRDLRLLHKPVSPADLRRALANRWE